MVFLRCSGNNLEGSSHSVRYRRSKQSGPPFAGAKVGQILGTAPLKVDEYYTGDLGVSAPWWENTQMRQLTCTESPDRGWPSRARNLQ